MTTTALQDSKALRTKAAKDLAAAQKVTAKLGPKVLALTAQYNNAQQIVDENAALITSLDAVLTPTKAPLADKADAAPVKAKPGPKPKAKAAPVAAAPAKPKGKPGPKPKAAKAAKVETKTAAKTRAAEGRAAVMSGARPSLKDAMTQVLGTEALDSAGIYDRLKAKGWLPNAQNPRSYIGYTLSSSKEHFTRVNGRRGFYTVKAQAAAVATPVEAAPVKAPKSKANGKITGQTTEQVLADAGLSDGSAFGG